MHSELKPELGCICCIEPNGGLSDLNFWIYKDLVNRELYDYSAKIDT